MLGLERIILGYQEPFQVPEDLGVPASLLLVVIGESCSRGNKVRATSGFSMLQVALSLCCGVVYLGFHLSFITYWSMPYLSLLDPPTLSLLICKSGAVTLPWSCHRVVVHFK